MGNKDVGIWLWNHLQKREENVVANALSRKDEDVEALLYDISIIQPNWIAEVMAEWKNDEKIWTFIQKMRQDPSASNTFRWKMTCYGTMIAYILVRVPNSRKSYFLNSTLHW